MTAPSSTDAIGVVATVSSFAVWRVCFDVGPDALASQTQNVEPVLLLEFAVAVVTGTGFVVPAVSGPTRC